ncbi:ribonuclease H-like domain-containing protein [Tanacetum coccineum]
MKLMQFLMGLDDTYMQMRSFILSRETLPYVRSTYATISSEESQRVVASRSSFGTSQRTIWQDSVTKKVDTTSNVFQELNHINFFDNEYPEIPNDDERVDPSLNSKDSSQSDSSCEPKPFLEASKHTKMKDLRRNDTWEITHLPKDRKSIGNKLDYRIKCKSDGEIERYIARLVAKRRKYCLDLLSEFGILACNPSIIPLPSKLVISYKPTEDDPLIDNVTEYQKFMGKLIYLTNTTHDISYGLHYLSKFMHSHSKITFKILRYLKGSPDLWYSGKLRNKILSQNHLLKHSTKLLLQ